MKKAVSFQLSVNSVVRIALAAAISLFGATGPGRAQVTTATFYGIVNDSTGAVIPNATATLTHQGTGAVTTKSTDARGEFAFDFLRVGTYTLRVEATGFKAFETKGITLAAGQTVRQTFTMEVGAVAETVTVEGTAPLVSTAAAQQLGTFESVKITELPLGRRNITSVLRLETGVDIGAQRSLRINGVGSTGTGVSVDGTDANPQPEQRGMSMYGSRNYIDIMSIDAVQEVQLVRGILPAEYGGVVGGQINLLSKSGTNAWHGSLFENYQSHRLNARNPFVNRAIPKPRLVFNQFGGSLGGPIKRNKIFAFGAYEGYRESLTQRVAGGVPTASFRQEILRALPFPETRLALDALPLPTIPRFQRDGSIDPDRGDFEGLRNRESRENHVVGKGDIRIQEYGNLSLSYTRMRPFGRDPRFHIGNDRTYDYKMDRGSVSFTAGRANWTSETRFGYNENDMKRLDLFFLVKDPRNLTEVWPFGRSMGSISVSGFFSTPGPEIWDMDGQTYTFDQKFSRHAGRHSLKFGGRFQWVKGFRSNPERPAFSFQTRSDLLNNIPSGVVPSFGSPGYDSRMYEVGGFFHDDWRVTPKLVLNLGIRYDFYSNMVAEGTTELEAGFFNLSPPTDWAKFDFGPFRDPKNPFEHDGWVNLGPRLGFAYNVEGRDKTVLRGGFGTLFTPHMPAVVRQAVANRIIPFRIRWSKSEAARLGLKWPMYTDELAAIAERDVMQSGRQFVFSAINPGLQNPYAMHYQLNLQRALTNTLMLETGYVGVRGVKFIMHRHANIPDRLSGERPNPNIIFGGPYYVDNSQNTVYNAWQTALRKRFAQGLSFDVLYTWGKGLGVTGGDVGAYYGADANIALQSFDNPRADRGPNAGDATHRFLADWIYELPRFTSVGNPFVRGLCGGWQVGGIFSYRSGEPFTVTQSCANPHCRPDYVGGRAIVQDYRNRPNRRCVPGARCGIQYLNVEAFARVPLSRSNITVRPGNVGFNAFRNPGTWTMDFTLARNFRLRESLKLQIRADMFNFLNHVNYGGPTTSINSAAFGEINGAGGTRVIQLNARLSW